MGLSMSIKLRQLPPRLAAGAFFLYSGIEKLSADEETAVKLHGFASGAYPFLGKLKARDFTKILAVSEIAIGAVLVIPVVPGIVAGAALTAFAGGTVGLYARTPGLRQPGSLRPTENGIPIAKDSWLVGIGLGLIIDDIIDDLI
ncbi:MAG: uncharacterized protein JWM19_2099 [Actinomycetia bacterium]|nr:uncharacterized protein [Actinomycetes bacterium]